MSHLGRKVDRPTQSQIHMLLDYMVHHTDFAKGSKAYNDKEAFDDEWTNLKLFLDDYGKIRTIEQWKTWRDLRKKARQQHAEVLKIVRQTKNKKHFGQIPVNSRKVLKAMCVDLDTSTVTERVFTYEIAVWTLVDNDELKVIVEADDTQSTVELAAAFDVSVKTILVHLRQIGKKPDINSTLDPLDITTSVSVTHENPESRVKSPTQSSPNPSSAPSSPAPSSPGPSSPAPSSPVPPSKALPSIAPRPAPSLPKILPANKVFRPVYLVPSPNVSSSSSYPKIFSLNLPTEDKKPIPRVDIKTKIESPLDSTSNYLLEVIANRLQERNTLFRSQIDLKRKHNEILRDQNSILREQNEILKMQRLSEKRNSTS